MEPDILVSDQLRRKGRLDPERQIMFSILEDAILCFQSFVLSDEPRTKALFQQAERWIMGKPVQWIFSFESVCDELELDPDCIRAGLQEWKRKALRQRPEVEEVGLIRTKKQRTLQQVNLAE